MKVNIIYQTIRQQIQMYVIAILLVHSLLLYNNNLWLIYLLCLVVSLIYFAMEFINLSIIQKNVRRCYQAFQNSISERILAVMREKKRKSDQVYGKKKQIQPELMHKLSSPYFSKIYEYFMNGYQILLTKLHNNQELQIQHSEEENYKKQNEKNYHLHEQLQCSALVDTQNKENMESKMQKFKKQIQEIQLNVQKETNIKLKFVKILIFKQLRQLAQTLIYALFILFLIGYKVLSISSLLTLHDLHQKYIEHLINAAIEINQRLTKEHIIFLIPLMINSIWKFQRICNEIKRTLKQTKAENEQPPPELHLSLIYKIIQPDSKSPLPISKNKQATMKELIQPNEEESVQVIATLIYFQCTAEALLSFYAIIQFLGSFSLRVYLIICPILHDLLQEEFGKRSYNIWEETKFIINRLAVLLLLLTYIGLKYHQSLNKTIGMKQALWGIHMTMDKVTKFISFDLRKWYHKRMFKIFKKLVKIGIVKNSQSLKKSQKMHNLTSRDELILQYYCSV